MSCLATDTNSQFSPKFLGLNNLHNSPLTLCIAFQAVIHFWQQQLLLHNWVLIDIYKMSIRTQLDIYKICCELNYYKVHMWDASCKVGLVMLKAFLKANQSPLFSPHAFDWFFQYKTKVSLWVWFFQSQYGQIYQYFWFLTHPSVKKRRQCYMYAQCTQPCPIHKLKVV